MVSPTSNIGVAYDTKNAQYVVDGTSVHGGSIQLYGQIMNTASSGGQLNVLDGYGTIKITNTGNIPVVLQTLNAGTDASGTGRGVAGIIDIMDIIGVDTRVPSNPVVTARHTIYTRDYDTGSGAMRVQSASATGTINNVTGEFVAQGAQSVTYGGNRTATYATTAGQRYVWTTGADYQTQTFFKIKGTQLFGSSSLTVTAVKSLTATSGPDQTGFRRLADGTYVTGAGDRTQIGGTTVNNSVNGIVIEGLPTTKSNLDSAIIDQTLITSQHSYLTQSDLLKTGSSNSCNWWTLCIAQNYTYTYRLDQKFTTITTNSLKADNPIAINFIGSDTGGISVKSNSNVVLTNAVTASNGDVKIEALTGASSIIAGDLAAQVTGKNVILDAAGSVGGITYAGAPDAPREAAIAVALKGGALTANAGNGNVSISSRGDLVVNQVTAAGAVSQGKGQVTLVAAGSISGANASALIQGPRVSLTAVNGSIGSTADGKLLHVNTGYSADPALRRFGDPALVPGLDPNPLLGLTAVAGGDIGISSSAWSGNADGTILLDRAISLGGDVRLVSSGWILDNNPVEGINSRTYDQLLGYWSSLGLLATDEKRGVDGSANADKQQKAIAAFENATTQSYEQYWQMRRMQGDGGAAYDPNFAYKIAANSPQYAAFVQQFGDAGAPAEIARFESAQTSLYHQLNNQVGGLTAAYETGFHYVAGTTERDNLTRGAVWTERELAFSLSPGALKTITATNPVIKDPNVAGRTVTLEAQKGIGETVGAGTAQVGVSIRADLDPRNLTLDQKVALAAAERSDLQLKVVYQGQTVDIPLGADYADLTLLQQNALTAANAGQIAKTDMTIVILAKRPLNFDAPTAINVIVADAPSSTLDSGTAYLASRSGALLGAISVQGETRIKVLGNIGNAASGSVSTGNLILESAQGSIGSSGTPLALSLRPNSTFTARAQNGVFVNLAGDARIDTVYSTGQVALKATGSLLSANKDNLVNVLGANVSLVAGGTIGSTTQALNVGNQLGGGISASAEGLINLYGPAQNLFVIRAASSTAGSITLTAGFEGVIDGAVTAPGQISLAAGGRFVVSALGQLHSTTGMIDVRAGSLKMLDGATMTADLGRIFIKTSGDALVTGIESKANDDPAHAAIEIESGGHVFAGNAPGRAFDLKAMSASASVKITAALGIGDKTAANTKWQDGQGDVPGSANALSDVPNPLRVLAGAMALAAHAGDIHVAAQAADVTVSATAGSGSVALSAPGRLHGTLLSAVRGSIAVTAEGDIVLDEVTAGTASGALSGRVAVRSVNGALSLGTVLSGGSQSFVAERGIGFASLTTTGLGTDPGDVEVTSVAAAVTGGDISAHGAIRLSGKGVKFGRIVSGGDSSISSGSAIIGASQTAGGSISDTAAGDIALDELVASGKVLAHSTGGAIGLGTARSGGSQSFVAERGIGFASLTTTGLGSDPGDVEVTSVTAEITGGDISAHGAIRLSGKGVNFGRIVSGGDSSITSGGDIIGAAQIAGGTVTDVADGDIRIGLVRGARTNFDAGGTLALANLEVGDEATLRAGILDVKIKQVPSGPRPLQLTLTGSKGGVGTSAHVEVDAPAGLVLPVLRFYESDIRTTARFVQIVSAFVPGSLKLATPLQHLLVENRSPRPLKGNNVQMYQPGFAFGLTLDQYHTATDAFVVQYDRSAEVTDLLGGKPFDGASLVRDSIRAMMHGEEVGSLMLLLTGPDGEREEREIRFDKRTRRVVIDGITYPVGTTGAGPAVQLSELN